MKKILCALISTAMLFGLISCGQSAPPSQTGPGNSQGTQQGTEAPPAAPDAKVCRIGLTVSAEHAYCKGIQYMAEQIQKKTNGSVVCDIYYDGSMGTDVEVMQNMQMGTMDGILCSTNTFSVFAPTLEVFDLPGLLPTKEVAYAVADSEIGAEILESLKGTGVTGMGFYEGGYYYLTNNKTEITSLDQLAGLKVRSQEATVQKLTWECLGMVPTITSFSELFTSLQQGVIDSQANIAANVVNSKVYEVQKYVTEFPMMYMTLIIGFSDSSLNSLTPEQRTAVEESVAEAIQWQRENYQGYVDQAVQTMADSGNVMLKLNDGELEKMVEACKPVYDYAKETHGDVVDRLLAYIDTL